MSPPIRLHVWGERACFTRPELKVERVSYEAMTPSAARGVLEAIHWKPAIRWVIERLHVLRPIRFQSIRRNEVGGTVSSRRVRAAMARGSVAGLHLVADRDRQQRASEILVDVAYVIEAHFELTSAAGPLDNEAKHLDIFRRRAARGQCFHQPYLGTREFSAGFALLDDAPPPAPVERSAGLGFGRPRDLGLMLWDIDHEAAGTPPLWFQARLENGRIEVPEPGSPAVLR